MAGLGAILKAGIEGITGPVATYFTRRGELAQARFEAKLKAEIAIGDRQARLVSEGLAADANWEMEFARQAQTSSKDEFALGLVSIPVILCFVSTSFLDGPRIVKAGFESLAVTPIWFQTMFCVMVASTVGVRWWRRSQSDT